jgi:23S rRNA pseudouridine2605 synthase
MAEERLQKILARAGVTSRRKAEELILAGRVAVNGQIVDRLGSKADFERDHIKLDGRLLRPPNRLVYLALYKPVGVVTTLHDPEGRRTVLDLVGGVKARVFPVGRLDYHSEGLLLLTNDGDFANRITSASSHVEKTYLVKVTGALTPEQEAAFREGIPLHGRRTAPAGLRLVRRGDNPWYEVRLIEGRQNQVRIMFKHFGLLVEKLKRTRIGHLAGAQIRELLGKARVIAVVGLSGNRRRPSYNVSEYMQRVGYRIIPVNPNETEVLGERCYRSLSEVTEPVDIVNIFRRPEHVPAIVEEAIRAGVRAVWMQEGVIHEEAAARAREAGLIVVMDRCILKEHRRLVR